MKLQPELQAIKIPEFLFMNLHNNDDYAKIPIKNLDANEVKKLLERFCIDFIKTVGYNANIDIEIY